MASCVANQKTGEFASGCVPNAGRKTPNTSIAMGPDIPTCQAVGHSASALTAATIPSRTPRRRIGAIAWYWKALPMAKATTKSGGPCGDHPLGTPGL